MTPACLTTDRSAPDGRLATYARSLAGAGYGGGESELARSPNLQSEIWALAVSSREAGTAHRSGDAGSVIGRLARAGIRLGFANPRTEVCAFLERSGVQAVLGDGALFTTLKSAVEACASGGFAETSETGTEPSQAPAPGGFQFPQPVSPLTLATHASLSVQRKSTTEV